MDASEADLDVKLQKISADLLKDFEKSLIPFLRKYSGQARSRPRSHVRSRETSRLTNLLDSFQEWPQLLDPVLPRWIPVLASTYLEALTMRKRRASPAEASLLMPVELAICKLLYHLCKVRGEKVVVRFLNNETKYLEVLLLAVEEAENPKAERLSDDEWSWEQRYIVTLWLSHLMLAPFDLATISSVDLDDVPVPEIAGLSLPADLPSITLRIVPLAIKGLASPSKVRDSAKSLLVQAAMRRDMQQLGVLKSLIQWAIKSLQSQRKIEPGTAYFELGILSFLAGVLRSSSNTSDMDQYLEPIFQTVHALAIEDGRHGTALVSLASARKLLIKVIRSVVMLSLGSRRKGMATTGMAETAIGHMLECLSDNDTPVRLAASKSLSIITLSLDPGMASQVVEAVLDSLNRNVLWEKTHGSLPLRDLSRVNNNEWHGLMLTLSHLLYRRSPPAKQLSDVVHALLLGLSFEQRGPSGGSIGSNVRDAACFGIWALARRYSTKELSEVPVDSVFAAKARAGARSSVLQVLAIELVIAGTLDPAGNIRRGASAALQELIGRHPDTVVEGIAVVQTVDYHAVARRSRAIGEVAVNAAKLSSSYGEALMEELLGWRGVGDADAACRRATAAGFGDLTKILATQVDESQVLASIQDSVARLSAKLSSLQKRQVEERHGLLLCLGTLLEQLPHLLPKYGNLDGDRSSLEVYCQGILDVVVSILGECQITSFRRPDLIAEAASQLTVSTVSLLRCLAASQNGSDPADSASSVNAIASQELQRTSSKSITNYVQVLKESLPSWLSRDEAEVVTPASQAGLVLLQLSTTNDQKEIISAWANRIRNKPASRTLPHGKGYYLTLARAQRLSSSPEERDIIRAALSERWNQETEIEVKVVLLQSLTLSGLISDSPSGFLTLLHEGLCDYTTSAQGDVGSHVRVEALKAVDKLWGDQKRAGQDLQPRAQVEEEVIRSVLRLSAEKLDRVRIQAQVTLGHLLKSSSVLTFTSLTCSSRSYFDTLLRLHEGQTLLPSVSQWVLTNLSSWMSSLLFGFATSADTGNEELVIASRAALTAFCEGSAANTHLICQGLRGNLRSYRDESGNQDRFQIPTIEIIAFLFQMGIFQRCQSVVNMRDLCTAIQLATFKAGNVKKIMASIKVYGGIACIESSEPGKLEEVADLGRAAARKRLGVMMSHRWPKVRSAAVDEIWAVLAADGVADGEGKLLTGVDWAKVDKSRITETLKDLNLPI